MKSAVFVWFCVCVFVLMGWACCVGVVGVYPPYAHRDSVVPVQVQRVQAHATASRCQQDLYRNDYAAAFKSCEALEVFAYTQLFILYTL